MRKCRHCKVEIPKLKDSDPIQRKGFCTLDHATRYGIQKARQQAERKQRRETAKAKERLKTKSDFTKEAQLAFNAYIRVRDEGKSCISCGRSEREIIATTGYSRGGVFDAGHYLSRGAAPELRFHPMNCHKQCKQCNNQLSGNAVRFRQGLVERYGQAWVDCLEGPHEAKRYTIDQLNRIKAAYRKKKRIYDRLRAGRMVA